MSNDAHDQVNSSGVSGWSYGEAAGDSQEPVSPEEVISTLRYHQHDGSRYWAVIRGEVNEADFADPVKATAWLVDGIKMKTGERGGDISATMETMAHIAEEWPTNDRGQPRWWTRDEGGKWDDARQYVFSAATDPPKDFSDPLHPWYRRQVDKQAERTYDAIDEAFWDCYHRQGYATVQAVTAYDDVDVTEERVRQVLDHRVEDGMLEKRPDPDADCPEPFTPRHYRPEGED